MPPINKNRVRTAGNDARIRMALASLLRHLGVLGGSMPTEAELVRLANDYVAGNGIVVDDKGKVFIHFAVEPDLDKYIPF